MEINQNKFDWPLLGCLVALICIGCTLVYTATVNEAGQYWQKQIIYFVLGFLAIAVLYITPGKIFQLMAYPAYFLSLIPLVYVSFLTSGGVERWIRLPGGLKLQPSEFAKLALLLALANYLSMHKVTLRNIKSLFPIGLMFIVPFLLVLKQPDLSTALVFSVTVF